MKQVFILLGSNLGDRAANIATARRFLTEGGGVINSSSALYKTAAWGVEDQPEFFNQAISLRTRLSARKLLQLCLSSEEAMGRQRSVKWGERLIDIDILFYGSQVISEEGLTIPHPQIPFRRFTLQPLCDIACDFVHPLLHRSVKELLDDCPDKLQVERITENAS